METLSKTGRREICKMVGIKNPDSIFVKSREAFVDRMKLLRVYKNTEKLVETYKEELKNFASEKQYIDFIRGAEKILYDEIEENLTHVYFMLTIIDSGGDLDATNIGLSDKDKIKYVLNMDATRTVSRNRELLTNNYILRFYHDSPFYEAYRMATLTISSPDMLLSDYIMSLTNCKFLACMSDIDITKLSIGSMELLKYSSCRLSYLIEKLTANKFLNAKHILYTGNSEIRYECAGNKTAQYIDKMMDELRDNDEYDLDHIKFEMFKYKALDDDGRIMLKDDQTGLDSNNAYNIVYEEECDLIKYLRKLYNEPKSKYDAYINIKGCEAKITQNIDIKWSM